MKKAGKRRVGRPRNHWTKSTMEAAYFKIHNLESDDEIGIEDIFEEEDVDKLLMVHAAAEARMI